MAADKYIHDPDILFTKGAIIGKDAFNYAPNLKVIKSCLNALADNETSCVIFGDRGVGKTTFAWQISSILTDRNAKFKKDELLITGRHKKFKCVHFKIEGKDSVKDCHDLLLKILRPSSTKFSLSEVFPILYEDDQYKLKFKSKFTFDLLGLVKVQLGFDEEQQERTALSKKETFNQLTDKDNILSLFVDVLNIINGLEKDTQIIFFIDEADLIVNKDGLGDLVKHINYCKFAFIGIADTIADIVSDHRSAGRKLIRGDYEIKKLSDSQIEWIFVNAEARSNGGIRFSSSFKKKAVDYSYGYPYIAQNLGHIAATEKQIERNYKSNEIIEITEEDFEPAINRIIDIYKADYQIECDFNAATSELTHVKILELLWNSPSPLNEDAIRTELGEFGKYAPTALKRILKSGVIVKTRANEYKYKDSMIRVLVRPYLDKLKGEL